MSDMQVQQVLAQMRALADRAAGADMAGAIRKEEADGTGVAGTDFSNLLKQSLEQVNAAEEHADLLSKRFVMGAADTSLPEVVLNLQKAGLQFEAVTQVRNRLLSAYQEIMNMTV